MAKITRKTQKIFGGNSSNNAQFGAARAGTFVLDNDPDVIQALPAWGSGINAATVSGQKLPALEEEQGVHYVETRQIAYILQEGIPEYDPNTEYHQNSIVKMSGTFVIYGSISNDNTGNALSNITHWKRLCDLSTVQSLNNFNATTDPTVNDDASEGYSAGSYWYNTVSGDTFFLVNPAVGAANWVLQTTISPDDLGALAFEDNASGVPYNNGTSGLSSTNVQSAIDELASDISGIVIPVVTPWVSYTPTLTGFGTPTNVSFFSRRVGDSLEIQGSFTSGTSTAVEARATLGFNGVNGGITISSSKNGAGIRYAGSGVRSNTTPNHYYMIAQGGNGYLNFGTQTSGISALNGSNVLVNTDSFIFKASVPIQGW